MANAPNAQTPESPQSKLTAARAFVRSLNILLKFVRMYGFEHARSAIQFDTAWNELREAVPMGDNAGMLLGASGSQLLLDGAPIEAAPAERSFARLLSAAGLASIQFLPAITREELSNFVRAFPTGKSNDSTLADQLKAALGNARGIRINEVRFVAQDPANPGVRLAAELTAKSLGAEAIKVQNWFSDPQKLLQLIAAAEGSRGGAGGGPGGGSGSGPGGSGGVGGAGTGRGSGTAQEGGAPAGSGGIPRVSGAAAPSGATSGAAENSEFVFGNAWPDPPPPGGAGTSPAQGRGGGGWAAGHNNDQILVLLRLLTRIGQASGGGATALQPGPFSQELSQLSTNSRELLEKALAQLAAQTPAMRSDDPMLVHLAEHLAIRFALDRYERGELRVNAVRQMLDSMSEEISLLRKTLGSHEATLAQAGIAVETHADQLDRRFWASVPETSKHAVLTSPEAWCIPPRNLRQYVEELRHKGEEGLAATILDNYAATIATADAQARNRVSIGLADLADLYSFGDAAALSSAIRRVGTQLSLEREAELQGLMSAAFVRLTQEAGSHACYPALLQALDSLDGVEHQRPAFAREILPRLGIEKRLPEFLAEAVADAKSSEPLLALLQRLPGPSAECLMTRFNRALYRAEKDRIVRVARQLGRPSALLLRERLQIAPASEAAETCSLLAYLDSEAAEKLLVERMGGWPRVAQDRVLRLLAASGAPQRGWLMLGVFELLDPLLRALALDEIGMSGEAAAADLLLHIAAGDAPESRGTLLQLKAIEALGRLGLERAADTLAEIAEARKLWRWAHHQELRLAAYHSLRAISPDWAAGFLPRSGFSPTDLEIAHLGAVQESRRFRQRRYPRIRLQVTLPATASTERESVALMVRGLSLGGGWATGEKRLTPGTLVSMRLGSGLRSIRAQAIMRDARTVDLGFEFVDMQLDDRARLRHFLHENGAPLSATAAELSRPLPADS